MVTSDLGACEWFVWDLRRSGLIDRGQLDSIVSEFLKRNPRAEAPALAEYLVHQGTLTAFQAERVLNGKTQGLVLGPYVLLDAIGAGSMGQVYKASSKNDNTLYAVKVLPRRSMWNVRLARRQVRSFSGFSHPAVVPFVDVGTAGGLHYLVWPLVEGTTLECIVQQMGKLSPNLAALYGVQIAQGLTVSHQNNLFHGLVKPSNIMVGSDNQARILDFGIGSLLVENEGESLVDTMSTANTLTSGLDCASPESIMEPANRTPAGDQYSLGCLLYYCLTGRVPFPEGSAVEKMMAHQTKEPMSIRELSPEVPEGLTIVVRKLMAKDPAGRYTGSDEVVEALEPYLGDLNSTLANAPTGASQSSGRTSSPTGRAPASPPLSKTVFPAPTGSSTGSHAAARTSGTGAHPTTRSVPGSATRSVPGSATRSANPAPVAPAARTPNPLTGRTTGLPSRASFQIPPMAEDDVAAAVDISGQAGTPRALPKLPTRGQATGGPPGSKLTTRSPAAAAVLPVEYPASAPTAEPASTAWAEEEVDAAPARGGFGPLGLVAAAVLLMAAVYLGATLLMKQ